MIGNPRSIPQPGIHHGLLSSLPARAPTTTIPRALDSGSNLPDKDDLPQPSERPTRVVCPVPDQYMPFKEYQEFLELATMKWPSLGSTDFAVRLGALYVGSLVVISLPLSLETYSVDIYPIQAMLAASAGSLAFVTVVVLRIYSGWRYMSNRLLSAAIEYEESSMADGRVWVKTEEMKSKDRLVAQEQCIPCLDLLRSSLLGLTAGLAAALGLLYTLPQPTPVKSEDIFKPGLGGSSQEAVLQSWSRPSGTSKTPYNEILRLYEPWALVEDMSPEEEQAAIAKFSKGEGFDYRKWGLEPPESLQGFEEGE